MLESLIYSPHNSIAVPDSVQKEVNLTAWLSEEIVNHPQLKQLAKSLQGILVQDRAPKTALCYVRAVQCHFTALPGYPGVFALYLVHIIQQGSSVSLLNSAIYGASWVHKKSGYPELGIHPLIQQVAEARLENPSQTIDSEKGFGSESSEEGYQQAWTRQCW